MSTTFIRNDFCTNEKLLRAVRQVLLKRNNRPSSAAFKPRKGEGLSVDRTADRDMPTSVKFITSNLEGSIFSVTMMDCENAHAKPKYRPRKWNPYHSEIHKSETVVELDEEQALFFAENAVCEYSPSES